jgi:hypothetical protein
VEIKIYAPKGTQVNLIAMRGGKLVGKQNVTVYSFGGATIVVRNTNAMTITATAGYRNYSREMTSGCPQVTFDFENKEPIKNYSQINVNPAVRGGIHSKGHLARYVTTQHFQKNLAAIEANPIEIQELRKAAINGKTGVVIVGPQDRYVRDSHGTWKVHTLVKGLTECGYDGQPLSHKTYYNIKFDKYVKAWVAPGRYGWVPAILVDCGNATMVYIPPPTMNQPQSPPSLSFAPPPETPMKVSWDDLSISVAKITQGNLVITPSSISSYVPQAKTDIKLSMKQSQGQNQTQNQDQTSVNTNINENTNINNNDISVNVPIDINNNNINQQNMINNTSNANN